MSEGNPSDPQFKETSGTTLEPDEYQQVVARRQRVRWLAVPIYFIAVVSVILLIKVGPVDEERFWPLILVVVYGGIVLLQIAMYGPYFLPVRTASFPDGELVPPPDKLESPEGIRELNHVWVLYKIAALMWFLILTPFVYMAVTQE